MSAAARQSERIEVNLNPAAWLIAPTLSLLFGQAMAAGPWLIPPAASAILFLPLFFLPSPRRRRGAILIFLAMAAFALGYLRHRELLVPEFPPHHLRLALDKQEQLYLEGTLRLEPERLPNRIRWLMRAERIWHPTGAEEVTGDMLIGLRSARRGIYLTGFLDDDQAVELLARDPGAVLGWVEDLRREIRRYVDRNFSQDNGALIKALVVGDMGGITKETRAAFTAAGVNHVLSISGLHVAMLGLVVFGLVRYGCSFSVFLLLRWNLLKVAAFCSFMAVVFYTALAGAMVPTVRSAIMIGVYELAVLLDREEEVFTSLTLAALLIALVWPGVIADISFQLSFLAVLFIAWGMRRIHERLSRARTDQLPQEKSLLVENTRRASLHLAVPLLATLGTGPLIAHYFGHLSLAGFVANPLLVPLVGFVLVPMGLTIGFLALVAPALAFWLVILAEKLSSLTTWLVDLFARLPLANFAVPSPNALEVAALYGLLLCLFVLRKRAHLLIALTAGLLLIAADVGYWWVERFHRKELRVTHLNVGQGDAAVVELPNAQVLLIDAGGTATGDFDIGESIVAPFLRGRKILKVDYLMVSHPRIDHYGGMRAIVTEFSPLEFWSGVGKGKTSRFEDLEKALARAKVTRRVLAERDPCRRIGEVSICMVYAPEEKADDQSVVVRLEHGKLRYLFAADIDKRDEVAMLLRKGDGLRSTVVKVPRHGSPTASSQQFVAATRASLAISSAGARSRSEASREEVAERYRQAGAEVLSTYDDGAIIVESDGNTLSYLGYKSGKKGERDLTVESAK